MVKVKVLVVVMDILLKIFFGPKCGYHKDPKLKTQKNNSFSLLLDFVEVVRHQISISQFLLEIEFQFFLHMNHWDQIMSKCWNSCRGRMLLLGKFCERYISGPN